MATITKTFKQETFVVIHIKGGNRIKINGESKISEGLLSDYHNSIKAELYHKNGNETILIDTIYRSL